MAGKDSKGPATGRHETVESKDDAKVRYQDGETKERDPEPPMEDAAPVLPEPTGTDGGPSVAVDPGEDAEGFNKETGFHEVQDSK